MSLFAVLVSLLFPLIIAGCATYAVRGYALRRLLDLPNARSSHSTPTPRGGGLGIVLAWVLAVIQLYGQGLVSFDWLMTLAGALPVAAAGFWDDHGHVPARWRLAIQVLATSWSLYWLGSGDTFSLEGESYTLPGWGIILSGVFVVWMLNLFNFMDGIDGIAGVEAITLSLSLALISWLSPEQALPGYGEVALALASASAGFLLWNWPPAKIFMGDVGSGFIGFLLGLLALRTAASGSPSLVVWLILAGVFWVDATVTLVRRMADGQRWYEAHRSHAYQHAARLCASHKLVTLAVLGINSLWLLPLALAASYWPSLEILFLIVAYAPLLWLTIRLNAGKS